MSPKKKRREKWVTVIAFGPIIAAIIGLTPAAVDGLEHLDRPSSSHSVDCGQEMAEFSSLHRDYPTAKLTQPQDGDLEKTCGINEFLLSLPSN